MRLRSFAQAIRESFGVDAFAGEPGLVLRAGLPFEEGKRSDQTGRAEHHRVGEQG
jgi:hypothetical protein